MVVIKYLNNVIYKVRLANHATFCNTTYIVLLQNLKYSVNFLMNELYELYECLWLFKL